MPGHVIELALESKWPGLPSRKDYRTHCKSEPANKRLTIDGRRRAGEIDIRTEERSSQKQEVKGRTQLLSQQNQQAEDQQTN